MPVSIQQLRTPVNEEDALDTILGYLTLVGFNATSWQTGSLQRKLIRYGSYIYSDLTQLVGKVVDFGYNETATGAALTELSLSHYDNERGTAVATVGQMRLLNEGVLPQTIAVSQLVAAYTEPDGTQRTYRNVTGGTVAAVDGTLDLQWAAETKGSDWNIPVNSTLVLLTPVAGVTVSNPAIVGTSTWITTSGADAESDPTLQTRNRTKWSTLSVESIRDTVVNLALTAAPNVTRVEVDDQNTAGAGTAAIYLATSTGPASSADVTAVQTALSARFFGNDGTPPRVQAVAALDDALNIAATVYYAGDFSEALIRGYVDEALEDFLATIPMGGFEYAGSYTALVPVSEIENAIRQTEINGQKPVRAVVMTTPTENVSVPAWTVLTRGTWNISGVPVE